MKQTRKKFSRLILIEAPLSNSKKFFRWEIGQRELRTSFFSKISKIKGGVYKMTTKAQRKAIIDKKVTAEKERILMIMRKSDLYTITLDPLIESYLDIFEIYQYKFILWKEKGFPETQKFTNKSGATNQSKHPLAQQVETWADRKMKALDLLGLTNKSKSGKQITGGSTARQNEEITRPEEKQVDELAEHRNKWRKVGGKS